MVDLREQLRQCFLGRVCLIGLGNSDYGDDGLGAFLAEALGKRLKRTWDASPAHCVINAGTTPERFIGALAEHGFDHLIFLDAVEFGGEPGSVIFLNAGEMASRFPQISTHKISVGLLAWWVEKIGTTKAWLLGVQPGSLKTAHGLTPAVRKTAGILEELLGDVWIAGKGARDLVPHAAERPVRLLTEEVNAW